MRLDRSKRPATLLLLPALAAAGLFLDGYRYAYSDQVLYIPMIEHAADPALFPDDYLFDQPSARDSLWIPALAALGRAVPLEWLFFAGHLITSLALVCAIYLVGRYLFRSRGAALLAVLLLLVPYDVGGTATATRECYFTLRSTAMPFAVGFLLPYFAGRSGPAALLAGLAFAIHPITGLPVVLLLAWMLVTELRRGERRVAFGAATVFLACVVPLALRIAFAAGASGAADWLRPVDPEWLEMIRFRDGYIFVSLWGRRAVRNLVLFWVLLLVGIAAQRRLAPGALHRRSVAVAAVCGLLLVAGIVLVEVVPVQLALQLQLLRSSYLVIYLGMILLAGVAWTAASRLRRPALRLGMSALLVAGAATGIALTRPEGPAVLDLPGRRVPSAWRDAGTWCREHTPPDALFLVPPDGLPGFRVHARRSIVVEWKDGAPLVFSRRYAEEWWSRMGELWGYADFDDARFRELHERYGVNYAVTRATRSLGFPELYRNGEFVVWDLRP